MMETEENLQTKEKYVQLTVDQKAVALRETQKLTFAAKQLYEWASNNQLTEEMAKIMPNVIENHFISIAEVLNYTSALTKEHKERYVEIRKLNQQVRELQTQLAQSRPIDGLSEQLSRLYHVVYDWWRHEGFGHISEFEFTSGGNIKMELSFMLNSTPSSLWLSSTPETDKAEKRQHVDELLKLGFSLIPEEKGSHYWQVVDNEDNRALIESMVLNRFPSARLFSYETHRKDVKGEDKTFVIRKAEVFIYDLRDI